MSGRLINILPKAQHITILTTHTDNKAAAEEYSAQMFTQVSVQNVHYWRKIFIEHKGSKAKADAAIKAARRLRRPSPTDDIGVLPDLDKVHQTVLFISDLHAPYNHPDIIPFLRLIDETYLPTLIVSVGDEVDMHGLSFHDSDPDLDSAGVELVKAQLFLQELYELFPTMLIASSNHGSMVYRKAKHHGIPAAAIKSYRDVLFPEHGAKGWSWSDAWYIPSDMGTIKVLHEGKDVIATAAHERCNIVAGHLHGQFEIRYAASNECLYWGSTIGCGIDSTSMAFAYGKNFNKKPIIGMMVTINGRPQLIPMPMDEEGRWTGEL